MTIKSHCKADNCSQLVIAKGYCTKHYQRVQKHGNPYVFDVTKSRNPVKHGLYGTKEHSTWNGIKQRCNNPKKAAYRLYGGRGIRVCDRWQESFQNFLEDVGKAPSAKHSLDRIDNNGNYEPGNCRWATGTLQAINKRKRIDNTSGKTGVCFDKTAQFWQARISLNKRQVLLGIYKNKQDAISAREKAEGLFYAPLLEGVEQ